MERFDNIRCPAITFPICYAANACIHGPRAAFLWELANGMGIRGDPQTAPTGRILRFPPKSYGFHQTRKKACPNANPHTICMPQSIKLQGGTGSRARHATYIPTCSSNHFVQNHWESMEICSRTLSLRIMIPKFGLDLTERGVVGMVETSQRNPC